MFTFKPALFVAGRHYHLFDDRVERVKPNGKREVLMFSDIVSARLAVTSAREYRFRRLDLIRKGQKTFKINISTTRMSTRGNDPDLKAFFDFIAALSTQLESTQPNVVVTFSEAPKALWIMFTIGVLSILAGAGMFALALLMRVPSSKLTAAILPMAILALFGAFTAVSSNPFKTRPKLSWAQLGAVIQKM